MKKSVTNKKEEEEKRTRHLFFRAFRQIGREKINKLLPSELRRL